MLKVEDRAKQLRLNHVFNIFHGLAPFCVKICESNASLPYDERFSHDINKIPFQEIFKLKHCIY